MARHIASCRGLEYGSRVLVAVSGGPDSVVLLDALVRQGFCCVIAHCNFHLRGEASDGDAAFVESLAASYGMEYCMAEFDTISVAKERKISIEMAARELRYEWFEQMADEHKCRRIAVAHNADDTVETFFLNLVRGTGIDGLCGMAELRGRVVRPMLSVSRSDIMDYIAEHGLEYRVDITNNDTIYRRNRIRHDVVPVFRNMNPSFLDTMHRNMMRLSAAAEIVGAYSDMAERECVTEENGVIRVDIDKLREKKGCSVLLYEWTRKFGFTSDVIQQMTDSLGGLSGKVFVSEQYRAVINRRYLEIYKIDKDSAGKEYVISEDVDEIHEPLDLVIENVDINCFSMSKSPDVACLDADKLRYPLVLRHWKNGDWFIPFGMTGRKKLSDFFNDAKLGIVEKEKIWLLCSGRDIVWILGMRIDGRYAVTDATKSVTTIKIR